MAFRAIFFVFFARSSAIFVGRVIAHTSRHKRSTTRCPLQSTIPYRASGFDSNASICAREKKRAPRKKRRGLRRYGPPPRPLPTRPLPQTTPPKRQTTTSPPSLLAEPAPGLPNGRRRSSRRERRRRGGRGITRRRRPPPRGSDAGGGGEPKPDPRHRVSPKPSSTGARARTFSGTVFRSRDASSSQHTRSVSSENALCFFAGSREASPADSIATGRSPIDASFVRNVLLVSFKGDAFANASDPKTAPAVAIPAPGGAARGEDDARLAERAEAALAVVAARAKRRDARLSTRARERKSRRCRFPGAAKRVELLNVEASEKPNESASDAVSVATASASDESSDDDDEDEDDGVMRRLPFLSPSFSCVVPSRTDRTPPSWSSSSSMRASA